MTVNVYKRYFHARGSFNGVERRGAAVFLISDSEGGRIKYEAAVAFFPHGDEEDFRISYDAYFSKVLYEGAGRRSKKREEAFLSDLQQTVDEMIKGTGAEIFWDKAMN